MVAIAGHVAGLFRDSAVQLWGWLGGELDDVLVANSNQIEWFMQP